MRTQSYGLFVLSVVGFLSIASFFATSQSNGRYLKNMAGPVYKKPGREDPDSAIDQELQEAEVKALKKSSNKTQEELDAVRHKLDDLQLEQKERESQALREKAEMNKAAQETNQNLEKKVALLEEQTKQRESQALRQKTEMDKAAQETNDKLEKKVALLELALKQLEDKSKTEVKNTKDTIIPIPKGAAQDLPTWETVSGAQNFVSGRRQAYREHNETNKLPIGNQWKLRGHGWLYTTHKLILAAEGPKEAAPMGRNVVKIWNVHPDTAATFQQCHLLTLWVRVNGPEIFAGNAHAVPSAAPNTACHWEYEFNVQKEGQYEMDVKLLLWNGNAPIKHYRTKLREGSELREQDRSPTACLDTVMEEQNPQAIANSNNNGFLGFKFYDPLGGCCEICRRTTGCIHWSTPPTNFDGNHLRNGCQLYYNSSIVPPEEIPKSHWLLEAGIAQQRRRRLKDATRAHGSPKSSTKEVAYFLGCGWSFHFSMDFPCLSGDLDDQVYMVNRTFVVGSKSSLATTKQSSSPELPLCRLENEAFVDHHRPTGRWVREDFNDKKVCPLDYSFDPRKGMFPRTAFDPDHPHCWHRDDLSRPRNQCAEQGCPLMKGSRMALSRWHSSNLHKEKQWMGMWKSYDCNLLEFTNKQLQQCIRKKKISSITTKGTSISAMASQYLEQRLDNLTLFPKESNKEQPSLSVVVDTLSWPHILWHQSEESWINHLQNLPDVTAGTTEHFFISSFYVTSERENYVQVARAETLARHAASILPPKGYKLINAFELSAAFAFDTAGQDDGMHLLGPPMKMALTKVFHHLCSNVVDGSIA